jgi:hypothetical protein
VPDRLRDTIKRLNAHQVNAVIRFPSSSDGTSLSSKPVAVAGIKLWMESCVSNLSLKLARTEFCWRSITISVSFAESHATAPRARLRRF